MQPIQTQHRRAHSSTGIFKIGRLLILLLPMFLHVATAGAQYDSLFHQDTWRTFLVHLPPQYPADRDSLFPLILALHGGFGSAANLENQSRLSEKADSTGNPFIVVYPEGVRNPFGIRTWNAGGCCGYARDNDIDDVGFISALIDSLLSNYLIDEDRVFVTGMSNGGMMSYRLAAELSHRIAAIAPVASAMVLEGSWSPTRPVPIIHFHSFLDESVPFLGGEGDGFSNYNYPPTDSILNVWSDVNGCTDDNDTLYNEIDEYLFKVWTSCDNDGDLHLYVTYDGGHSWPGGEKGTPWADPPSEKICANDLMWTFFQEHPSGGGASILEENGRVPYGYRLFQNYPNPFNPETTISFELKELSEIDLSIYNVLGRKVRTLASGAMAPGHHTIGWNGKNSSGIVMPSGVYIYRLKVGEVFQLRKMILAR